MADSSCVSVRILLVLLMLDSVYCQVQISVPAGSPVLLNCSYTAASNLNVYWRYKDIYTLVDIKPNGMDISDQDPRFKDRIVTFPERYAEGNFAVRLENVNLNDAGPYNCYIPKVDYRQKLHLTVRPTEGPTNVTPMGDGVSVREHSYCPLLSFMLSVTLLVSM